MNDMSTLLNDATPEKWYRVGRRWLLLVLVLAPLVYFPPGKWIQNPTDTPPRLWLLLGIGVLAGLLGLLWAAHGPVRRHPLDRPVLALALALLITALFGAYPINSFFQAIWNEECMLLQWCCGIVLYFAVKEFARDEAELHTLLLMLTLTGGFVAALGLLDRFLPLPVHFTSLTARRLGSTLQNPMFAGTFFATLLPVAGGLVLSRLSPVRRGIAAGSLLLMLAALAFTQARAAWLGFAVMGVVVCLLVIAYRRELWQPLSQTVKIVLPLVILGVLLSALLLPGVRQRLFNRTNASDLTIQNRLLYMETAWNMFLARPITGWGPGSAMQVSPQFRPFSDLTEHGESINRGYTVALPHNLPLLIAAEMGLVGLAALCWLLWGIARTGLGALGTHPHPWLVLGAFAGFIAYFAGNLSANDNVVTLAYGWVTVGILAALTCRDEDARPMALPAGALVPIRTVCVLLLVWSVVHVLLLGGVSRLLYLGARKTEQAAEMPPTAQARAMQVNTRAIAHLEQARLLMLLPDHILYNRLFEAYSLAYRFSTEKTQADALEQQMLTLGQQALAQNDRDWEMLRQMTLTYLQLGKIPAARDTVDKLARFEPMSAEVCLLQARVAVAEGKADEYERVLTKAISLDSTFPQPYLLLAQLKLQQFQNGDPRGLNLLPEVVDAYDNALKYLPSELDPTSRLEYVTTLFMVRQSKRGITEGRKFAHTREFNTLCGRLMQYYTALHQPEEGQRLVEELLKK